VRARVRGRRGRGRREASLGEAGRSASGRPSVVHNRIRESTRPLRSPLPRTRAQVPAVNLCPAHACGARLGLRRKWATLRRREAAARSPLEGKTRSWVAARRSAKDRFAAFPHRQSADFERLVAHKVRAAMPPAAWTVTRAILGFGWMDGWMDGWMGGQEDLPTCTLRTRSRGARARFRIVSAGDTARANEANREDERKHGPRSGGVDGGHKGAPREVGIPAIPTTVWLSAAASLAARPEPGGSSGSVAPRVIGIC
jgi:hypothetical protein